MLCDHHSDSSCLFPEVIGASHNQREEVDLSLVSRVRAPLEVDDMA